MRYFQFIEGFMIDLTMFDDFKIEAIEMFSIAEDGLLNIDKGLDFISNYNLIFRSFHSVKGAAGMFEMDELQNHMHNLETLFEAQKKNNKLNKAQIDYFLKGIDAARSLLAGEPTSFKQMTLDELNGGDKNVTSNIISDVASSKTKKSDRKNGVIFVVDDEPELVDTISRILEEGDYVIHKFYNGQEALDSFNEFKPDLVVSDIMMPNLNGIDMLKSIYRISPNTPVVFISGNLSKEKMIQALEYGAYAFFEKPFDNVAVLNLCRNAITKNQAMLLVERSIKYMLYQFSDLDEYLESQGKENIRSTLKNELQTILEQRQILRSIK